MKTVFLSICIALTLSLNTPVYANTEGISKQEAINIAQQTYPGRVLAVTRKGNTFRVKTLNESGEVRIIQIDIMSGNVVSEQ